MTGKVLHWVIAVLAYGLPIILASHSPLLDLTVGTLINGVYLWVSHILKPTAPVI